MSLIVSTRHADPRWRLDCQVFAIVENGEWNQSYRIGGDRENGYYAVASHFGCGKTRRTPMEAIRQLAFDNGCTSIIDEML